MLRSVLGSTLGRAAGEKTLGRGMLGAGLGLIAARIATRSLPGAALVGGGLVAKYLWDRKREREEQVGHSMTADAAESASAE